MTKTTDASPTADATLEPGSRSKRLRTLLIGTVVGALLLAYAFQDVSVGSVVTALSSASVTSVVLGMLAYLLYLVVKAYRWSILLSRRTQHRPFWHLFRTTVIGTAGNTLIPHSGEFVRAYGTRKALKTSVSSILGSIAGERFYDFFAVFCLSLLVLVAYPATPAALNTAIGVLVAVVFGVLLVLIVVAHRTDLVLAVVDVLAKILPERFTRQLRRQVRDLGAGIKAALSGQIVLQTVFFSLLQWALVTVCIYAGYHAVGIDASKWVALIILPLTIVGLSLPTAPAYVGTLQVCFLVALEPFGAPEESAIAAGFVYTGIIIVPVMLGAAVSLVLEARFKARQQAQAKA